jgi:hypothetical protein
MSDKNTGPATLAVGLWLVVGSGLAYGIVSTAMKVAALFG